MIHIQNSVSAYFWLRRAVLMYTAVHSQKAVFAYFASKQILPFGFAEL